LANEIYVGRVRSVVLVTLLTLITLGIYYFIWLYKINDDLKRHHGRGSPVGMVLLFLFVPVIGWFLALYLTGRAVKRAQLNAGVQHLTAPIYAGVWAGLVPVLGWLIAAGSVQHGANHAWLKMSRAFEDAGDVTLECPDCDNRFTTFFNALVPHSVACPQCGRAGDV
jgi:hypothetical protein